MHTLVHSIHMHTCTHMPAIYTHTPHTRMQHEHTHTSIQACNNFIHNVLFVCKDDVL